MPKKSGKKSGKPTAKPKKAAATTAAKLSKPQRLKQGEYKSLRLQKRLKHSADTKLPSSWQLAKRTVLLLWEHKRLFTEITLIYGFVNLALVQGFSGGADVSSIKNASSQAFSGHLASLGSGLSTFITLLGTSNGTSQTASAYQIFLGIITSLALIWALRKVLSGAHPHVRDTYYKGMPQLIPFILVLTVIGLQLLPLIIGTSLYTLVINNGIAVYAVEKIIWALLSGALALLSFYMLSSSLFALYIVTLPDMAPMQSLRSAKELVRNRRWIVMRKLLCLPIMLLLVATVIMVPIIVILTPLARWIFFLLTMFSLAAIHTYMYSLYRELLNE